jgi:hypothetical protein
MLPSAARAETRGYVIGWVTVAVWSEPGDCPNGLNPQIDQVYRQIWLKAGKTPAEIDQFMATKTRGYADGLGGKEGADLITFRGKVNGKAVNVYQYPESVPDPNISLVSGRYALGFNLDGKGADDPHSFEEPVTHERGIDNNLMRIYGCFGVNRAKPPERATSGGVTMWGDSVQSMPAWLLTVTGDDLSKDGKVTVTIERGLTAAHLDSQMEPRYQTFRVDPDPRWRNVFQAELKNNTITSASDIHFQMPAETYFTNLVDITQSRLRLELKPDGSLDGVLGGYLRWLNFYWGLTQDGLPSERFCGMDFIGVYYAYKKLADADPDPVTGLNTRISSAFRVEAVPAFVISTNQQLATATGEGTH